MGGRGAGGGGKAGGGGSGSGGVRAEKIGKIKADMKAVSRERSLLRSKRVSDRKMGLPVDPKASARMKTLDATYKGLQMDMGKLIGS